MMCPGKKKEQDCVNPCETKLKPVQDREKNLFELWKKNDKSRRGEKKRTGCDLLRSEDGAVRLVAVRFGSNKYAEKPNITSAADAFVWRKMTASNVHESPISRKAEPARKSTMKKKRTVSEKKTHDRCETIESSLIRLLISTRFSFRNQVATMVFLCDQ